MAEEPGERSGRRIRQNICWPFDGQMRFSYKLARSAGRKLQEIADYWMARAGEGVALRIVSGILETIITLSSQPRAGTPAEQFGDAVRKFAAGKYIIYYVSVRPRQSRSCTCSTEREIDRKRGWAKPSRDKFPQRRAYVVPTLM